MENRIKQANKILFGLVLTEIVFCLVYFFDFLYNEPFWRIHQLFDLDQEASIPTWFSTIQLFMIGVIALFTAYYSNEEIRPTKKGLRIFGLGFIYLSLDEAASIHEKLTWEFHNNPLVPYFDGTHGVWIVVYGVIGLIVLGVLFKDLRSVGKSFRSESVLFVLGMIVFLAGAGGAETITYFFIDKTVPLTYAIEVIAEEFLEMFGASILLYSVLLFTIKKLDQSKGVKALGATE